MGDFNDAILRFGMMRQSRAAAQDPMAKLALALKVAEVVQKLKAAPLEEAKTQADIGKAQADVEVAKNTVRKGNEEIGNEREMDMIRRIAGPILERARNKIQGASADANFRSPEALQAGMQLEGQESRLGLRDNGDPSDFQGMLDVRKMEDTEKGTAINATNAATNRMNAEKEKDPVQLLRGPNGQVIAMKRSQLPIGRPATTPEGLPLFESNLPQFVVKDAKMFGPAEKGVEMLDRGWAEYNAIPLANIREKEASLERFGSQVNALAILVGRAMGEGRFTDQDRAVYASLQTPSKMRIALETLGIGSQQVSKSIQKLRDLLEEMKSSNTGFADQFYGTNFGGMSPSAPAQSPQPGAPPGTGKPDFETIKARILARRGGGGR